MTVIIFFICSYVSPALLTLYLLYQNHGVTQTGLLQEPKIKVKFQPMNLQIDRCRQVPLKPETPPSPYLQPPPTLFSHAIKYYQEDAREKKRERGREELHQVSTFICRELCANFCTQLMNPCTCEHRVQNINSP